MHLKQYLEETGLTKAAFAEKAGLHHTTITLALRGQGSERTLRAICKASAGRVTPNDILFPDLQAGAAETNGVRRTSGIVRGFAQAARKLGLR